MPITLLFGAAGPPLAGYIYDRFGGYEPFWYVSVALMVLGAALVATTPPPGVPHSASPTR